MKKSARATIAFTLTALALSACGGGGGNSRTVNEPEVPPPLSSDTSLASLEVSTGDLDQVFDPGIKDYTATTTYLGRATNIIATANHGNATVSINGAAAVTGEASETIVLADGPNLVTVNITAEDGVTSDSYSVDITRADAAGLEHLEYVKASNTDGDDRFGHALAFSGDTFAVAAAAEDSAATVVNGDDLDNNASGAGAVYVFRSDAAGTWVQEAYLKASNAGAGHAFGHSIALDGDTLVVGAYLEDSAATGINGDETDTSAVDAGAAYVFVRDATGTWSQQAYIKASNTEALDHFGVSVALSGDTLAIGAHQEDSSAMGVAADQTDNGGTDSGAVYVFTRDVDGNWTQQAYLKASNTDAGDGFGSAIALSQDTLVVGAPNEAGRSSGIDGNQNSNNSAEAGAVYVFGRDLAGAWSQQAYVKASNSDGGDNFGATLSLSGDTFVVGAPREDSAGVGVDGIQNSNRALNSGAAYVFGRDVTGTWSQLSYLKASNTGSQDEFGRAVTNHGDFIAVGALEDSSATDMNGDESTNTSVNSGAAYLFVYDGIGSWSQVAYIKAPNTGAGDSFGASLAIGEAALLIGADLEQSIATGIGGDMTDDSAPAAGAAYLVR
jgi:hypothetical protein